MVNIEEFREVVRNIAISRSTSLINNEGVDHASCLLSAIFDYSNGIRMFSGSLSQELTEKKEYFDSLKMFLDKGSKFELLLQKYDENKRSKALDLILSYSKKPNSKVLIRSLESDNEIYEALKQSNNGDDIHFTLGDNNTYRYEYHPSEYKARASFNDKETNEVLNQIFYLMFDNAANVD